MAEPALKFKSEEVIPHELVLRSQHFLERWMWTHATSRYTWWDALRARPLRIPSNALVHLHGWRRFICLELHGEPGEEVWVRHTTWDEGYPLGGNDMPLVPSFSDIKHFSRKLGRDFFMLLLSPATFAMALLYLFMFALPLDGLTANCTPDMREPMQIYIQIAATLLFTPVLTYAYYRLIRGSKMLSYEVRRMHKATVAALMVVSLAGLAWLSADAEARNTIAKIQLACSAKASP